MGRFLVAGKKGTYLVEKPYFQFDLIHDEGVYKYISDSEEERVREVEIGKPSLVKGQSFIPTVISARVDKGNGEFYEVLVRYPFASKTAKVVAEGVKTDEGIKYTKVYSEPVNAYSVALDGGFTYGELKEIYEKLQNDDLSVLHEKWKGKPFNAQELIEDLKNILKEDRREFVYLTGRKDIKDAEEVKLAEETLGGKVAGAIFKALKGEKEEGIDIVPLNGILLGVAGSQKAGFIPVLNMFPDRVRLTSTTYLGKSLVKNRDYTRLRWVLKILNPAFIKSLEENLLEAGSVKEKKLEQIQRIKEKIEKKLEQIQRVKEKIENENYKKLLDYIERNLKYNEIESLKSNINKLKREVDAYFNEIMEREEIINYSNLFVKTKDGYMLRNQIHNVGIDEDYAKELLFNLPPSGDKGNVVVVMQAVPRLVKDPEKGFTTRMDMKPAALVKLEGGEITQLKELKSDIYAKMFEEKIYRRLKFILNAKSFEQAKALLGDGFEKYKGLNELKTYFAGKKIAVGYLEFVDYLQKKLGKANSLEEMKQIIENDTVISEFKRKLEAYEKNQKIVQSLLSTEKGNQKITEFVESVENALQNDTELLKSLKSLEYALKQASLGEIKYKIDAERLQSEIRARRERFEKSALQNVDIELLDFEEIVKDEAIVEEAVAQREKEIQAEQNLDEEVVGLAEELAKEFEFYSNDDLDPLGPEL